jgi:hypothetical protein
VKLQEKVRHLTAGIHDYIEGEYPNPRKYRPAFCPHGMAYYETCEQCIDEYFEKLLREVDSPSEI